MPGDKSVSHRVLMLGSTTNGESEVRGFLEADDTRATLRAVRTLSFAVESHPRLSMPCPSPPAMCLDHDPESPFSTIFK